MDSTIWVYLNWAYMRPIMRPKWIYARIGRVPNEDIKRCMGAEEFTVNYIRDKIVIWYRHTRRTYPSWWIAQVTEWSPMGWRGEESRGSYGAGGWEREGNVNCRTPLHTNVFIYKFISSSINYRIGTRKLTNVVNNKKSDCEKLS